MGMAKARGRSMLKKFRLRRRSEKREKEKIKDPVGPIVVEDMSNKEHNGGETSPGAKPYHFHFEPNNRYFTISLYVLAVLTIGIIIIQTIINLPFIANALSRFMLIIQPFVVAFFIAFIINPIVKWLAERFFGKLLKIKNAKACLALGILTAYVIVVGAIIAFCFYVVPQISESISTLSNQVSDLYQPIFEFLNSLEVRFPSLELGWIEDKLNESLPQIISAGTDLVKNLLPKLLNLSISIAKLAINILLSIAISIYMLYDKRTLSKNATRVLYAFIPKKKAASILRLTKECGNIFTSFIVGKTIDSTIIGIMCFVIMSILGLEYAVLLSVIVGVTNMIPYFGPFIGAIPGILLYLCIKPVDSVVFAIMILALQQFDGWILGPKILGDSTGLTPLWVIFGITVGGAYGGVFGMFLGVPIVAVVAYLSNLFISYRLKKKNLQIK